MVGSISVDRILYELRELHKESFDIWVDMNYIKKNNHIKYLKLSEVIE